MNTQRPFTDFDDESFDLSGPALAIKGLQKRIRAESSMIRNWGHFNQVEKMSRDLFAPIDPALENSLGFNANHVISVFKGMIRLSEAGSSAHRNKLADLVRFKNNEAIVHKYFDQIGQQQDAEKFIVEFKVKSLPKEHLMMIMSHQDLFLRDIFTFTPIQLSQESGCNESVVEKILDFFSLQTGDLKNITSSEIFLENPIRNKPVIKLDFGNYFCPVPQVFFSFIFPALDKIVEAAKFNGLAKRRAKFLEDEVERIVKTRFPSANTVRNVKWRHEGNIYENDLVTVIDSYAIIFEAKSGRITPAALRGAPARIKNHLDELLIAPNLQSRRLAEKIKAIQRGDVDQELISQLPAEFSKVKKVIRVSVSLEPFSAIQSHVWSLKDTGWLPNDFQPCPSIGLGDFEVIFEILEHPVQIIHYLERRAELELELKYLGDEMDLLGLYLGTLFDLKIPPDENYYLNIYGMSAPIDEYYTLLAVGQKSSLPKANISKYWSEVLNQLENRKVERWTELGSELLRFSPSDQLRMAKMAKSAERNVHRNWKNDNHENIFIYTPPPPSETSLAMFLYKDVNSKRRHEYLDKALEQSLGLGDGKIRKAVVIGRNIDQNDIAYHMICLGE